MGQTLKQVSFVQYFGGFGNPSKSHGGEVRFTDGSFIWLSESIHKLNPKIGDGIMVNRPLWR